MTDAEIFGLQWVSASPAMPFCPVAAPSFASIYAEGDRFVFVGASAVTEPAVVSVTVDALRTKGVSVAYVAFEDEQHGSGKRQ